jgi:cyclic-di-GMP-binding protein
MADSSFDVVSKIDRMELDNAINQAIREIDTRFDFKNTGAKIEMAGEKLILKPTPKNAPKQLWK